MLSEFHVRPGEFLAIVVLPRLFLAFLTLDFFFAGLVYFIVYFFVFIRTLLLGRHVHLALSKIVIQPA